MVIQGLNGASQVTRSNLMAPAHDPINVNAIRTAHEQRTAQMNDLVQQMTAVEKAGSGKPMDKAQSQKYFDLYKKLAKLYDEENNELLAVEATQGSKQAGSSQLADDMTNTLLGNFDGKKDNKLSIGSAEIKLDGTRGLAEQTYSTYVTDQRTILGRTTLLTLDAYLESAQSSSSRTLLDNQIRVLQKDNLFENAAFSGLEERDIREAFANLAEKGNAVQDPALRQQMITTLVSSWGNQLTYPIFEYLQDRLSRGVPMNAEGINNLTQILVSRSNFDGPGGFRELIENALQSHQGNTPLLDFAMEQIAKVGTSNDYLYARNTDESKKDKVKTKLDYMLNSYDRFSKEFNDRYAKDPTKALEWAQRAVDRLAKNEPLTEYEYALEDDYWDPTTKGAWVPHYQDPYYGVDKAIDAADDSKVTAFFKKIVS